jgi:multicomponent K+:H+ antiporter subunit E
VPLETEHEQVNTILGDDHYHHTRYSFSRHRSGTWDILVHALSTDNEEMDIQDIKNRYEAPLMEIFDVKADKGGEA